MLYDKLEIVNHLLINSGKGFNDLGKEFICLKNNYTYYLLDLKVNVEEFFKTHIDDIDLYRFLEMKRFYIGICMLNGCQNFFQHFFSKDENQQFFDFFKNSAITNINVKTINEAPSVNSKVFIYVLWIIIAITVFKSIFSVIGYYHFRKKERLNASDSQALYYYDSMWGDSTNKSEDNSLQRRRKVWFKLYKIISFKTGIKNLNKIKTKFFDDTGLECLGLLRFILIFLMTFNHNLYTLFASPHKDFATYKFISDPLFFIVKLSTFSSIIWILVDGFEMSYKLMSQIKKINDHSFKIFIKFWVSSLCKFVNFFIILYLFYLNFSDFGVILGKTSSFDIFYEGRHNRVCKNDVWTIFIPFFLQYFTENLNESCFRHVFVYLNEFICLTLVLFIFYICFKIRSRLLDILLTLSIVLLPLTKLTRYDLVERSYSYYTSRILFGDPTDSQFTHIFFFYYFLGILTGLIYFYYKDIISSCSMEQSEDYIPFSFTFYLMTFIDSSKRWIKYFIFYFSITLLLLISNIFFIFRIYFSDVYEFTFDMNDYIRYTFIFENVVFAFISVFAIIGFIMFPNVKMSQDSLSLFVPFNRIGFCYNNLMNSAVYLIFSIYSIQIYFNYQTITLITIGIVGVVFLLSSLFFFLFEVPYKIANKIFKKKLYSI
jgi:hypothetical protein